MSILRKRAFRFGPPAPWPGGTAQPIPRF